MECLHMGIILCPIIYIHYHNVCILQDYNSFIHWSSNGEVVNHLTYVSSLWHRIFMFVINKINACYIEEHHTVHCTLNIYHHLLLLFSVFSLVECGCKLKDSCLLIFRWCITTACHVHGLMQERRNSSALAMELCLSCINPLMWRCHEVNSTQSPWLKVNCGSGLVPLGNKPYLGRFPIDRVSQFILNVNNCQANVLFLNIYTNWIISKSWLHLAFLYNLMLTTSDKKL